MGGAIRAVAAGQAIFGPGIASRVLGYFASPPPVAARRLDETFPELTERERQILTLLADGRRTAQIAGELYLSPKTVSNNLTSIFAKLEVTDRAGAIIRAREGGLGEAGR
jgi:DNA-binding NarL/FixJ family response regulator